ncbi:MAG: hypothetical protein Q4A05_10000, partial [Ruminococcus sp.]|nr:hypothetical protein [Ruminococcus sp.]
MDRYEKSAEFLMKRGDEMIAERKRRRTMILRSFAIGVGATAVLGVGLTTYALRPPKKPTPTQSGIIVETETTSAETTAAHTSPSTTAPKTTTTKLVTTTAVSTNATTSSARQTVTTVRTTVTEARMTRTAVATTAATSPMTTTAAQTTGAAVQTTAVVTSAAVATTELPVTDIEYLPWKRVVYGENKVYRMCSRDNEQITAAAEDIGEYYGEGTLRIDDEQSACKLYTYKDFSPTYVCAVKETADSEPKLYYSSVNCDTLGELLEATDFENTVVIKEAYRGFRDTGRRLEVTPTLSDLMKALSDTSLERSDASSMNSRSYTLVVEIPELGVEHGIIELFRSPGELSKSGFITFD